MTSSLIHPSHKSHNALDKYLRIYQFVTEMCLCVHISVTNWCISGYRTALLDFLDGSTTMAYISLSYSMQYHVMLKYIIISFDKWYWLYQSRIHNIVQCPWRTVYWISYLPTMKLWETTAHQIYGYHNMILLLWQGMKSPIRWLISFDWDNCHCDWHILVRWHLN